MAWNWQQADWPAFTYDAAALGRLEQGFLLLAGEAVGAFRHIDPEGQTSLRVDLISDEAIKTSEIEGEFLNRDSVQSSLRRHFGLGDDDSRVPPAERGIAEMMVDLYDNFATPLSHDTLFGWQRALMRGARLDVVGGYRTHAEAMQVVSGRLDRPSIHFEAPPSNRVSGEMDAFIAWFNRTAPNGSQPLPAVTRAGLAHLHFVSIHPFEDGNGRIGRALSEKILAQALGQPSLIALAYTIQRSRKRYYEMLELSNKHNQVTDWLGYFGATILEAQRITARRIDFHIAKTKLYDRLRGRLNDRQDKVIARLLREGIDGFKGGLSAENYIAITRVSRSTATRDLQDLVAKAVLTRVGERRYARYQLSLDLKPGHQD